MDKFMRVFVNGRSVKVPHTRKHVFNPEKPVATTLLDAIRKAGGNVPTLCYSGGRFDARAVCRLCLVEVEGMGRPQPACSTIAYEGARIVTHSPELEKYRRADLRLTLSHHPKACMTCEAAGSCKLQSLAQQLDVAIPDDELASMRRHRNADHHDHEAAHPESFVAHEHHEHDHSSPAIWRDMDKCVDCGLCVDACGDQGQGLHIIGFAQRGQNRSPQTFFDTPLRETNCVSCGQCTAVCPTGALVERPAWRQVLGVLDARSRTTLVQVAPATRVAIGEEFGMGAGSVSTDNLVRALRLLGFDHVFDTNFTADLTIMEEGNELLERVTAPSPHHPLPMFTSCCPGWVSWVELNRPDLLPHLSTTKSPQQMFGAVAKRGPFGWKHAEAAASAAATGDASPDSASSAAGNEASGPSPPRPPLYVVSIMPCTAKKDEAARPGMVGDVDAVLTTRELARMIRARGIPFAALAGDYSDYLHVSPKFDSPLGESTGAAQIFGASGGVMEAALRTAVHQLFGDGPDGPKLDFKGLRGVGAGVKSIEVPGVGRVAAVSGIAAAANLLSTDAWRDYTMIEVMTCVGGCLGGGGEPKSDDPDVLQKRKNAVYRIDVEAKNRRSFENQEVQAMYRDWLEKPLSHKSHEWLHTTYLPRARAAKSPDSTTGHPLHQDPHRLRMALARFLDAVDRRQTDRLADLVADNFQWDTNHPDFGTVSRADLTHFVRHVLPPNDPDTPQFVRHRLADPVVGLEVIQPGGEHRSTFRLELNSNLEIEKIKRIQSS